MIKIDSKIPEGPVAEKWTNYKAHQKLVNPANKRRLDIIVVGTGLAGASAAASLGEMGFRVFNFCIQDSPRRAHSIAAQGGINAAKNYQNDGDSVYRLFYDTVKGGVPSMQSTTSLGFMPLNSSTVFTSICASMLFCPNRRFALVSYCAFESVAFTAFFNSVFTGLPPFCNRYSHPQKGI
jgi:hypothetical protein